jgi:hypothetical protein
MTLVTPNLADVRAPLQSWCSKSIAQLPDPKVQPSQLALVLLTATSKTTRRTDFAKSSISIARKKILTFEQTNYFNI